MPTHAGTVRRSIGTSHAGFTLIELMVTVAIVAILTAIALPSYQNYVIKSHVKGAGADLVALALVMENQHQLSFVYPGNTANITSATSGFSAFGPSEAALFSYAVTNSSTTAPYYVLTATGSGMVNGCTLTLDSANNRGFSAGSGTRACGGLTTW